MPIKLFGCITSLGSHETKWLSRCVPPSFLIFTNLTCSNDHYSNNLKISQCSGWTVTEWLDQMSRYCQLPKNDMMFCRSQSEGIRRLHQPIRSLSIEKWTWVNWGTDINGNHFHWHLPKLNDQWPLYGKQRIKWTMICLELSPNVKCNTV